MLHVSTTSCQEVVSRSHGDGVYLCSPQHQHPLNPFVPQHRFITKTLPLHQLNLTNAICFLSPLPCANTHSVTLLVASPGSVDSSNTLATSLSIPVRPQSSSSVGHHFPCALLCSGQFVNHHCLWVDLLLQPTQIRAVEQP